jgi:uncharacterized protein YjbJ (UPF0337 family)
MRGRLKVIAARSTRSAGFQRAPAIATLSFAIISRRCYAEVHPTNGNADAKAAVRAVRAGRHGNNRRRSGFQPESWRLTRQTDQGVRGMDWNRVEGNWKQVKGKVKEQWGNLTDDDLNVIAGKREQLEGKIQERYGIARDQARKEIDDWASRQS